VSGLTADTIVRSRIATATKDRTAAAPEVMGLTISHAIRLLPLRMADENRLPSEVKVPSAKSRHAMRNSWSERASVPPRPPP